MKRAGAVLVACILGGCALFPLSEAECRRPDRRAQGYADGYAGHPPQDMRLVSECRERYGAEVDAAEYLAGWRDGNDEWSRLIGSRRRGGGS